MSATIALGCAPQADPLRQLLVGQRNACCVATCVGDLAQLIKKSQRLKHGGIDANAYCWISLFDALKSGPASKGSFSHNGSRETAPPSCIPEIVPKLAQSSSNANGRPMRGGHKCNLYITQNVISVIGRLHYASATAAGGVLVHVLLKQPHLRETPGRFSL